MLAGLRGAVGRGQAEFKDEVSLGWVINQLVTTLILERGVELVVAAVGSVAERAGKQASIGSGIGDKDAAGGENGRRDRCGRRWCGELGERWDGEQHGGREQDSSRKERHNLVHSDNPFSLRCIRRKNWPSLVARFKGAVARGAAGILAATVHIFVFCSR